MTLTITSSKKLLATDDKDVTVAVGSFDLSLTGDLRDNVLTGNDGDLFINAGAGNDSIFGGTGDDYINGADGIDSIFGGDGRNSLYGGIGDDTITGGSDRDKIDGGEGIDFIDGGEDRNKIDGGKGDDSILSGSSADTINGGEGNDFINGGDGRNVIDGGKGDDLIVAYNALKISGGEGIDDITLHVESFGEFGRGVQSFVSSVTTNVDGGVGNDYIQLAELNGTFKLLGGAGDDYISHNPDQELVFLGSATLDGGAGDDHLYTFSHLDVLTGGAGLDVFELHSVDGSVKITDFKTGVDHLFLDLTNVGLSNSFALASTAFASGVGLSLAATADTRFIYNTTNGQLLYDADGTGAVESVPIALLGKVPLISSDIFVS